MARERREREKEREDEGLREKVGYPWRNHDGVNFNGRSLISLIFYLAGICLSSARGRKLSQKRVRRYDTFIIPFCPRVEIGVHN